MIRSSTKTIILILSAFFFLCCEDETKEVKLARFKNVFLYQSELFNEVPLSLNEKDSTIFVDNYIHKWLVDQMIMEKSEEMIPQEVISVNKKINKYKLSLISYEFEQFYINKRLDTSVSDFEIKEYYKNHLDDFVLNDYVVKCMYMKFLKCLNFIKWQEKITT